MDEGAGFRTAANTSHRTKASRSLAGQELMYRMRRYFTPEVPRAGARLTQYYSRSRWTQGQVYTWLRVKKQAGRGEASSGLGFDRLVDKDQVER